MSAVIPSLDEIRAAVREEIDAALARRASVTSDHKPTDEIEPKVLATERKCTESNITKKLKKGTIRGRKIGGRWAICRGDVCPCRDCVAWAVAGAR